MHASDTCEGYPDVCTRLIHVRVCMRLCLEVYTCMHASDTCTCISLSHTHTHTLSLSLSLSLSLPRYEDGVGGEGRDVGKGEEITV
jgi:hypothetical protein